MSEVLAGLAARLELLSVLLVERGLEKEEKVQGTQARRGPTVKRR